MENGQRRIAPISNCKGKIFIFVRRKKVDEEIKIRTKTKKIRDMGKRHEKIKKYTAKGRISW
jgi:hypothetical protein